MKLVTVSLSQKCVRNPRCSFCYQQRWGDIPFDKWRIRQNLQELLTKHPEIKTFCFEYSGYNLGFILEDLWILNKKNKTMTTMPELITPTLCGALRGHGFSAIALSYDDEKCTTQEWINKSKIIKAAGLKVSCNFLLARLPPKYELDFTIPNELTDNADQLNILIEKPTGDIGKNATTLNLIIEGLKSKLPVAVDNCLGIQLGLEKECGAGKEFIHILPNGGVIPCSFTDWCFLWVKK